MISSSEELRLLATKWASESSEVVVQLVVSDSNGIISLSQVTGTVEVTTRSDLLIIGRGTLNHAFINFGRWQFFGYEQIQREFEGHSEVNKLLDTLEIEADEIVTVGLRSDGLKLNVMIFSVKRQ